MSLTRLLKSSVQMFQKDIISFLIIRRHDLGVLEEKLRYIAVRPYASTSVLRHKVWYLLDLPDYCDEIIILKNHKDMEIPLAALRKGNDPTHPYILEVYPPEKLRTSNKITHNMLTMGDERSVVGVDSETSSNITNDKSDFNGKLKMTPDTVTGQYRTLDSQRAHNTKADSIRLDLASKISSSSLIHKLSGRKSRDNFTSLLFKLQNDLSNLSNKLSNLETRVQPMSN